MQLFRLKDGSFQVIRPGPFPSLIDGPDHLLVDRSLTAFLSELRLPDAKLRRVTILRRSTGQEWCDYSELTCINELTPENIDLCDVSGIRLWHFGRTALFVSPDLMTQLVAAHFDDLRFSPGFSEFAG